MEQVNTDTTGVIVAANVLGKCAKLRTPSRKAVGVGCLLTALILVLLIGWAVFSYFNAPQPAWSVAWSPDGEQIATGFGGYGDCSGIPGPPQDHTVRIWDVGNLWKPREVLTRHTARVMDVAFSPDGKWLASGDEWGKALLWDRKDLARRPTVLDDDVYPDTGSQHLVFSPNSQWLAGGGGSFQEVGVWDVTDPLAASMALISPDSYLSFAGLLPDNKTLAAVSAGGRVGLWDRTTPGAPSTLLPNRAGVSSVQDVNGVVLVALSPDGEMIAGPDDEGTMWLWDLTRLDAMPTNLPGNLHEFVSSIDFSPAGKHLVASARDAYGNGKTLVWDLDSKSKEPGELRGAASYTTDVEFSPDGKWLAASGYDGSVRVWQTDSLDADPQVLGR